MWLLYKFIPKSKIRQAHVAYLFTLIITWFLGLVVAELGVVEYPVRQFPYSYKAHFLFEYFLFPSICALFVVNYPEKKSYFKRFMYYFYFCATFTIAEVIEERYTNILKYIHWSWYVTFITMFFVFYIVKKYNFWFFKKIKVIN